MNSCLFRGLSIFVPIRKFCTAIEDQKLKKVTDLDFLEKDPVGPQMNKKDPKWAKKSFLEFS